MPSISAAQHNFMAAAMNNPAFAAKHHIKPSVAAEFVHADKGKPWQHRAEGGDVVVRALHHAHDMAQKRVPRDAGGYNPPNIPYTERADIRGETALPSGLIHSSVAGRTDQLPMSPAAGSYVLPADVVSGIGEGNTMAGAAIIDKYLHSQPYGIQPAQQHGGHSIPHPPAPYREHNGGFRAGGKVHRTGNVIHYAFGGPQVVHAKPGVDPHEGHPGTVPIVAAGGEYIVPPNAVAYHPGLGMGDPRNPDPKHRMAALKRGHAILDKFVTTARKGHIKDLKHLPGPAK